MISIFSYAWLHSVSLKNTSLISIVSVDLNLYLLVNFGIYIKWLFFCILCYPYILNINLPKQTIVYLQCVADIFLFDKDCNAIIPNLTEKKHSSFSSNIFKTVYELYLGFSAVNVYNGIFISTHVWLTLCPFIMKFYKNPIRVQT